MKHEPVPQGYRAVKHALPIALVRAREAVLAFYRPMIAEQGFTEPQWRVLRIVNEYEPLDVTTLAEYTALHMPSVTRILQTLEKNGYIVRERDENDTRRSWISTTTNTKEIMYKTGSKSVEIRNAIHLQFDEEKINQVTDLLNELALIEPR